MYAREYLCYNVVTALKKAIFPSNEYMSYKGVHKPPKTETKPNHPKPKSVLGCLGDFELTVGRSDLS